jgi:hypothetical protein
MKVIPQQQLLGPQVCCYSLQLISRGVCQGCWHQVATQHTQNCASGQILQCKSGVYIVVSLRHSHCGPAQCSTDSIYMQHSLQALRCVLPPCLPAFTFAATSPRPLWLSSSTATTRLGLSSFTGGRGSSAVRPATYAPNIASEIPAKVLHDKHTEAT